MPFPFNKVENRLPPRSVFNLSHEKKFSGYISQLIPVLNQEMVPGDSFKVNNEIVIRMNPLVAPVMHEINAFVHYFFVPYRILWDNWESFITGGKNGDDASVLPRWSPVASADTAPGTLWDYLIGPDVASLPPNISSSMYPIDLHRRAYLSIFNNYYRDQNLQDEYPLDYALVYLQNRRWEKDYFTSALPWQQRGTAPALPVGGSAVWDSDLFNLGTASTPGTITFEGTGSGPGGQVWVSNSGGRSEMQDFMNANSLDTVTFDIADLRYAFQIQRWMERNARSGVRYTEFLNAHFGVHPRDDRLQRPEYIGGSKSPVIISEVLQTSSSDETSPQGNMAGHGISADRNYISTYTAQEYGVMMGIFSVMPRTSYQQGINRQLLRQSRYDFYFPEFANLSEQEVYGAEIYWSNDNQNNSIFGYQGRYDELRYIPSTVHGLFKTDLASWHLGRKFANRPLLNNSFTRPDVSDFNRIFQVETEPHLLVSFANIIRAVRPLPAFGTPGLIDHG